MMLMGESTECEARSHVRIRYAFCVRNVQPSRVYEVQQSDILIVSSRRAIILEK